MENKTVNAEAAFYGCGNVFADLGLPDAEEMLTKAKLASAIQDAIEERSLSQQKAAELMGINQPKVPKILRGGLADFSTEWLLMRLLQLGLDVEIIVHKQATPQTRAGALTVAYV